ncbi:histidine phosphotransferase family protein [Defluviimonas sp. SAOS-178_SWC]|uniref:histidine phosphotransferase family protein n=1 Tax=Defluviimonas sp. SAOS-178_SWC TaxID=3121287 RepID=UPI0032220CCF
MSSDQPDVIALLGSRICHDLISPLSAIGNGVELLMMSGTVPGPELALISESVTNANARIRFFRIAYGAASPGQSVVRSEIRSILDDMTRGGRLSIDWQAPGNAARIEVKLAFLALQCLETALPYGGRVTIAADGDAWRIGAEAAKMKVDENLWSRLTAPASGAEVAAAHVQFLLFPAELARQGRRLTLQMSEPRIAMRY